ncbi:MAG: CRISPR-associated endonuclease Cas2 [Thermodesulfobacteriota bacterium]|nr:CRISPR-associated endonuclease Cas2 [Thermodesulfobacteriota bacterium]
MKRKGWYLIAYDIANPSRLSKIHRKLKSEGLAVQKSLFLVQGTEFRINQLLDRIASIMVLCKDDLRAYPIMHPSKIWTNGPNPLADFPVLHFGTKEENFKSKTRKKPKKSLWKRLLGL